MTSLRYPYVIRTVIRRTSRIYPYDIRAISTRQPYIFAVVLHSRDLRTCDGFSDGRCRAGIWPSRNGESGIIQVARGQRTCTPASHLHRSHQVMYDIRTISGYPYDIRTTSTRTSAVTSTVTSTVHPTYIPLTSAFLDVRCPPLCLYRRRDKLPLDTHSPEKASVGVRAARRVGQSGDRATPYEFWR